MRKFREMIFSGGNKGFTLIELLVVIAVLGILAGIAIPRITGVRDEAEKSALVATATTIRNAVEMYIAAEDTFPTTIGALSSSKYNLNVNLDSSKYGVAWDSSGSTTSYSITVTSSGYSVDVSPDGVTKP
jgi:prepilin-type N-terminal cleavage/methylation domain-containing protein